MMERAVDKEKKMDEQEQKIYCAPTIVLEMELETRAGSSLSLELDDYFDGEE